MGERKGTNKYYPPDFDPKRHKSLNAYHGVHALRERGRKADQGVLIIRFEMPFNCWCLSCKKPIGMGVRYNAEKRKVGMYHSTPIYQFTMNCAMCAGAIVIQTDPQNFDYTCIEGVRRKCQTWDAEENEQIVIPDYKEKQKLAIDAMYQVEHGVKDKEKAAVVHPAIAALEASKSAFKDDFALNCLVRKQFREAKRAANKSALRDEALVNRLSLAGSQVKLLPEVDDDLIRLMHGKYKGTSLRIFGRCILFYKIVPTHQRFTGYSYEHCNNLYSLLYEISSWLSMIILAFVVIIPLCVIIRARVDAISVTCD
ncbi:unnamed protein product [Schistocephalus solidus]|uniref:DUF572-domain-containing protein n=1 Tax=Schistocephalus solidus TaxID=70667 RepID=A0A183TK02_SCHSO|nr:unnamed protein product [Schistocephalus solidus]